MPSIPIATARQPRGQQRTARGAPPEGRHGQHRDNVRDNVRDKVRDKVRDTHDTHRDSVLTGRRQRGQRGVSTAAGGGELAGRPATAGRQAVTDRGGYPYNQMCGLRTVPHQPEENERCAACG